MKKTPLLAFAVILLLSVNLLAHPGHAQYAHGGLHALVHGLENTLPWVIAILSVVLIGKTYINRKKD